jgi:hypothetical protein
LAGKIILEGFAHQTIPTVIGIPTFKSITKIKKLKLNANSASVHSNLGDGVHGLLALTVDPAVFNTLPAVQFVVPVNPGAQSIILASTTTTQISEFTHWHSKEHRIWKE